MNQFDEHILQMHPLPSSGGPSTKGQPHRHNHQATQEFSKLLVGTLNSTVEAGWFWFDILVVSVDWVLNILEVVPKLQRVRGWRLLGSDFCKGI